MQFAVAGETFEDNTLNEFPFIIGQETPVTENNAAAPENIASVELNESNISRTENQSEAQSGEPIQAQAQPEITPLEKAMAAMCPIGKYKDKTLGEMVLVDPKALAYVAKSGDKYGSEISAYAILICENAIQQVS